MSSFTINIVDDAANPPGAIPRALGEAKGDLLVATGPGVFVRLPAPEIPEEGVVFVLTFDPVSGMPSWTELAGGEVTPPDGNLTFLVPWDEITSPWSDLTNPWSA